MWHKVNLITWTAMQSNQWAMYIASQTFGLMIQSTSCLVLVLDFHHTRCRSFIARKELTGFIFYSFLFYSFHKDYLPHSVSIINITECQAFCKAPPNWVLFDPFLTVIYRMLPPPPFPLWGHGGIHFRWRGRGWGDPIPTKGRTLRYYVYNCTYLYDMYLI
jgi:hypothetical protein